MALSAARGLASRSLTTAGQLYTNRLTHSSYVRANLSRQRVACMATAAGPKYWLLNYTYVPDILEKRGPYREAHLAGAKKHLDAGRLVAAGAVGDPVEGATFFFKDISKDEIEAFVAADPYVVNGLVPSWKLQPFTVVVGSP